ncbi:N-acetylmuramoyl-L-alanine amidase [Devosia sediminis]|uniref:N-acetylmuramoyl-L-alanine amidase n=1 Tax=Devosia sediminis TaxID=2798801 RepID=A0A934MSV7_9HYPH|nr:N-acetylmuramoyl-L-alanine amidase [Devosia sediminis]MBJ3786829.1 amidase [Devosia sediminis]
MTLPLKSHKLIVDGQSVEFVKSPYVGEVFASPPKILVMHFTYGGTAASSADWFKSAANPGSSAHVVIERDGTVIQCVPFNTVAWHAGKSKFRDLVGLNHFSLGIELANWGYLQRTPDGWQTYTQKKIADPILAIHPNGNPDGSSTPIGWEGYPDIQVQSAALVARELVAHYGIDTIVGHEEISRGRKWDPGPAFDLDRFRSLVFGGRQDDTNSDFQVSATEGLNLRSGPSTSAAVLKVLPLGTSVEVLQRAEGWFLVSVLNANGQPDMSGWVNGAYLS